MAGNPQENCGECLSAQPRRCYVGQPGSALSRGGILGAILKPLTMKSGRQIVAAEAMLVGVTSDSEDHAGTAHTL
jgi:hypothetical protein